MISALDGLDRKEFWLQLNPELSITDIPLRHVTAGSDRTLNEGEGDRQLAGLIEEGYFFFPEVVAPEECRKLAQATERLVEAGLPTPFLWAYDEAWQLFARNAQPIAALLGPGFLVGGDLWVWHVAAQPQGAGWGAQRDANVGDELLPDGRPAVVTAWIPVTDATPDNGCMYVLPQDRDPHYPESLDDCTIARSDLASIRALPAKAGSIMGWNTRLLHWGARSSRRAVAPRISLSMYVQRGDVDRYNVDMIDPFGAVPLHHRLGVVSRALLTYSESGLSGTTISEEIASFAREQRSRLSKWLAVTTELRESGKNGVS